MVGIPTFGIPVDYLGLDAGRIPRDLLHGLRFSAGGGDVGLLLRREYVVRLKRG